MLQLPHALYQLRNSESDSQPSDQRSKRDERCKFRAAERVQPLPYRQNTGVELGIFSRLVWTAESGAAGTKDFTHRNAGIDRRRRTTGVGSLALELEARFASVRDKLRATGARTIAGRSLRGGSMCGR